MKILGRCALVIGLTLAAAACGAGGQPALTPPTATIPAPTSTEAAPTGSTAVTITVPTATVTLTAQATPPISFGNGLSFGAEIRPEEMPDACKYAQDLGIKANTIWEYWDWLEPQRGTFDYSAVDQAVSSFLNCGVTDLGLHFVLRNKWATITRPTGSSGNQLPPKNPQDLYDALYALAGHLKGQVREYSIENEANDSNHWGDQLDSYFAVLPLSKQAIQAADPSALVEESGTASSAWGLALGAELLQAGQTQTAIDTVNGFYAIRPLGNNPPGITNATQLQDLLTKQASGHTRYAEWFPKLYAASTVSDVSQIHFYGPSSYLKPVFDFAKSEMQASGKIRPIEVWEIGYGWLDRTTYNPQMHANETVKLLTISAGEGASRVIYWKLIDDLTKHNRGVDATRDIGLIQNDQVTSAAMAFKVTVQKLAGSTSAQLLDFGNPEVEGYRFMKDGNDTFVLWSTAPTKVSVPVSAARISITDVTGKTMTADSKTVTIGDSPIFVQAAP